jgi:hypothetical protein
MDCNGTAYSACESFNERLSMPAFIPGFMATRPTILSSRSGIAAASL